VIDEEHYDRANDSDDETVDIDTRHSMSSEETEQPSADNGTHDSQNNVEDKAFSRLVDDFTPDKTCNQT
jgi:hypothetical protein